MLQPQTNNIPPFMDGMSGNTGNALYNQMKGDLSATPNSLYNQSEEKKRGMSFKEWINKERQPGGKLDQAQKKYGGMFEEWLKGKFGGMSSNQNQNQGSTERGDNLPPSSPAKEPMSLMTKIGIGIGVAALIGAVIGGVIYFKNRGGKK